MNADEDKYAWLRDPKWPNVSDPAILSHLEKENERVREFFDSSQIKALTDDLYVEMLSRIKLDDRSVPLRRRGGYFYFSQTYRDKEYSAHFRYMDPNEPELILDENALAEGHEYFSLDACTVSPCTKLLAYSSETDGDERYTLAVKDLAQNSMMSDVLEDVSGCVVWMEDSSGFFYVKLDEKWRGNRVYYHELGQDQERDVLIYEEKDQTFTLCLSSTSSTKYVLICSESSTTSEVFYIDSRDKSLSLTVLWPRKDGVLADADHIHDFFYVRTNDIDKNFRLVSIGSDKKLVPVLSMCEDQYLRDFYLYDSNLVATLSVDGQTQVWILEYDNEGTVHRKSVLTFGYDLSVIWTVSSDDGVVLSYSTPVDPRKIVKRKFACGSTETLKEQELPCGYNADEYCVKVMRLPSLVDGTLVPVTVTYKKDKFRPDMPLVLYGYGSYGSRVVDGFRTQTLSLLDRGFAYAVAHVRGGDELGYDWYESAKFLNKKRTFEDFVGAINGLIASGHTAPGKVAIWGGSAGGMLVGCTMNMADEGVIGTAIADVPFVDVLNTMLDPSLPLTPGEYKEWGNPAIDAEYFNYIKSYSPYDNISARCYPHIYAQAGLSDPRVGYWEPAKWIAKIREMRRDSNLILLETNMHSGHFGESKRFSALKDLARQYAFLITTLGLQS